MILLNILEIILSIIFYQLFFINLKIIYCTFLALLTYYFKFP